MAHRLGPSKRERGLPAGHRGLDDHDDHTMTNASDSLLELRDEVVSFLEEARHLLTRAGRPLSREPHYGTLAAQVDQEVAKVRNLELRLAVVAPMKAGKSTIINAILGQGVLPTRNSAMTSLPSEIVCDPGLREPVLHLSAPMVARFEEAWRRLREEIVRRGRDRVAKDIAEYPEIGELARTVADSPSMQLKSEIAGRDEVRRVLRDMSDLSRLATAIDPDLSPLVGADRIQVPRIRAPFLRLVARVDDSAGRVVIVDTPGPNEARQHEALQSVISAELSRTSVVLVVLDFTQLNTQAAEFVSAGVRRVVDLVGEENLLVLVNKIDERVEDKGMKPDEVRRFVASHLRLRGVAARGRVFEISAKQAFCAADFLRELAELGSSPSDEAVRALPRARELAMQTFGATDWEEELRDASAEKLARRAEKLWRISQFDAFLTKALESVMTNVAPRALLIALRVARAHLLTLRNDASIRSKGLAEDSKVLRSEIDSLDDEIAKLVQARKTIERRVRVARDDLREQLRQTRRGLQRATDLEITSAFREARRGQETFSERLRRRGARFALFLGFDWQEASPRLLTFASPLEAEEFATEAVEHVLDRVRPQIEAELARVDRGMEKTCSALEADIDAETRPIVLRAVERLQKRFDVRLEVPKANLGNPLAAVMISETLSQRIDGGYYDEVRWERKWYVLWLFNVPVKYRVRREDLYVVSLDDVSREVNRAIHDKLRETATRFEAFLEGEFRDRIDEYFLRFAEYLTFYRQSVENAQASQLLSLREREKTTCEIREVSDGAGHAFECVERLQAGLLARVHAARGEGKGPLAPQPLDLFFSYSHSDEDLRDELENHLAMLKREGVLRAWHDRKIGPGEEWDGVLDETRTSARRAPAGERVLPRLELLL